MNMNPLFEESVISFDSEEILTLWNLSGMFPT
jgi:hypothetical protein